MSDGGVVEEGGCAGCCAKGGDEGVCAGCCANEGAEAKRIARARVIGRCMAAFSLSECLQIVDRYGRVSIGKCCHVDFAW